MKYIRILLIAALCLSFLPISGLKETVAYDRLARPITLTALVNGKAVAFDAYSINGSNYFKLRDIAYVLNGSTKQFGVGFDRAQNTVTLTSGQSYVPAGGEMAEGSSERKVSVPTSSKVLVDGEEIAFTAYNIDGSNYFMLHDIGRVFDFGVDWNEDNNTVIIDTEKGYDNAAEPEFDYIDSFFGGFARVQKGGKWGLIRDNGKVAVPLEYDYVYYYYEETPVQTDNYSSWDFFEDKIPEGVTQIVDPAYSPFTEGLARVVKDGKYGFVNEAGELAIPLEYDFADGFWRDTARVLKDGKCGFIDRTGKAVIPFEYDAIADNKWDPLLRVLKDGKCGFIDMTGNVVIPFEYDNARRLYGDTNYISVQKDGKWGIIDLTGETVIPFEYENASYYPRHDVVWVTKGGKEGVIDLTGKVILPIELEKRSSSTNDRMLAEKDGKCGIISITGEVIAPFEYDIADEIFDDYILGDIIPAKKDEKYGFLDIETGDIVIPFEYDTIADFEASRPFVFYDFIHMQKDGKWGIIDNTGEILVPFEYDYVYGRDLAWGGFAIVEKDGKQGYVDKTGKVVIPLQYDKVSLFSEDFAIVQNGGKYGYIDKAGKEIAPLEYDYAWGFSEGLARVRKDDKNGFIDTTGKVVIPFEYDDNFLKQPDYDEKYISPSGYAEFANGIAVVQKDEKYGCIDKTGKTVLPIEYDFIGYYNGDMDEYFVYPIGNGFLIRKDNKWGAIDRTGKIIVPLQYESPEDLYMVSDGLRSYMLPELEPRWD